MRPCFRNGIYGVLGFLALSLFFFLLVPSFYYLRDIQNLPIQHQIGNRASTLKGLEGKGLPFSFLVIGDTHGSERGEELIELALKHGHYPFMIHVGDIVQNPDQWEHLFFLAEMTEEVKPPFPIFLVPGNHDIDYASLKIKDKDRRTTRERYDSLYGARRFHFTYSNCLFILTEIDPQNPEGYLQYLQKVLSSGREGMKYVFVFIHYPPRLSGDIEEVTLDENAFYSLLETYRVTACFFGHHHGYLRWQRNGVTYIIVGGGGRHKEKQSEWGKFHHIMKVTVEEQGFSESLIVLSDSFNIEDRIEKRIFINLLPVLQHRVWVLYVLMAISAGGGAFALFGLFRCSIGIREQIRKFKKSRSIRQR